MNGNDKNPTDAGKRQNERRTEIAMLYLLMDKYPNQAKDKLQKPSQPSNQRKTASL